jgi:hypothetical protein
MNLVVLLLILLDNSFPASWKGPLVLPASCFAEAMFTDRRCLSLDQTVPRLIDARLPISAKDMCQSAVLSWLLAKSRMRKSNQQHMAGCIEGKMISGQVRPERDMRE